MTDLGFVILRVTRGGCWAGDRIDPIPVCNEMALVNKMTISKLTFQKNMNKIAERSTTLLERVHVKRNIYHYILLNKDDDINIISSLRINPTRSRHKIATRPALSVQSPTNHSSNSETTLKPSDKIKTMTKSDLPMALSFFFGKDRAKEIKIEEERYHSKNERISIKFGIMLRDNLKVQVSRLNKAFMTFNGWRDIVRDCDCKDRCTEFQIFKTRMKALYLSRLYQLSIDSYDTIPHFSDIANEALSQINNSYALDDHDAHSMIKDHHTLRNWFRQYRDNGCSFPNPSTSFTNKHDIHPFLS